MDRSNLRSLADNATPGPWRVVDQAADEGFDYQLCCIESEGDKLADWVAETVHTNADAAFIAAASPPVVLSLLDRIAELEVAIEAAENALVWMDDERLLGVKAVLRDTDPAEGVSDD